MILDFLIVALLICMVASPMGCHSPSRDLSASKGISVVVVSIDDVNPEDMEYLVTELKGKFGNCIAGNRMQMPAEAYRATRSPIFFACPRRVASMPNTSSSRMPGEAP